MTINVKDAAGATKPLKTRQISSEDVGYNDANLFVGDTVVSGTNPVPVVKRGASNPTPAAAASAVNTDLITGTVSGWFDAAQFNSASIMVIGGAGISAGQITFEQTNDTTLAANGVGLVVAELTSISANPVLGAITIAASTTRLFSFPILARYIRCRISTAFVGGTVQAVVAMSQDPYATAFLNIQQATATSLQVAASGSAAEDAAASNNPVVVGGVVRTARAPATLVAGDAARATINPEGALLTAGAHPASFNEVTLAARTASGNSGTISCPYGGTMFALIGVQTVSGTSPTCDIFLEESLDGANWLPIWQAPRITASNVPIYVPPITVRGIRRWSWVIAGTTPSFQFNINSYFSEGSVPLQRRLSSYAITPNVANNASGTLDITGCSRITLTVTSGAGATVNPVYAIDVADDFVAGGIVPAWSTTPVATLTVGPSETRSVTVEVMARFARIRISTAGTGATHNAASITATAA